MPLCNVVLLENGTPLLLESGGPVLLEGSPFPCTMVIGLANGRAWQLTPSIGIGAINWIACATCTAGGLVLDTRIEYEFNNSSIGVGGGGLLGGASKGSAVITKAIFKY